jgi:hypothetical protein
VSIHFAETLIATDPKSAAAISFTVIRDKRIDTSHPKLFIIIIIIVIIIVVIIVVIVEVVL